MAGSRELADIHLVTRRYLEGRGVLEPIGDEEFLRRVRAGEVTLVDVRPPEEYVAGHRPGAVAGWRGRGWRVESGADRETGGRS